MAGLLGGLFVEMPRVIDAAVFTPVSFAVTIFGLGVAVAFFATGFFAVVVFFVIFAMINLFLVRRYRRTI
jgi:hypothetical protein